MRISRIFCIALIGGSAILGACTSHRGVVRIGDAGPHAYRMQEGGDVPTDCCDHGDRLDIRMKHTKGWQGRCLDMGGRPTAITEEGHATHLCTNVDF